VSVADDIMTVLARRPGAVTGADLALALGQRHQHVNQVCNQLAARGLLRRTRQGAVIVNLPAASAEPTSGRPTAVAAVPAPTPNGSWDWEGNVQAALCHWLTAAGWSLEQDADTASRQRGTDVVAARANTRLHLEVKGYPSTQYADPRRAREIKPMQPSLQAHHWYAEALLSAIRLRGRHPDDQVAIGLPDAPRDRALVQETRGAQ
jgi:hypothetical protein